MSALRHGLTTTPAQGAFTITPSDTVDLVTAARGIYVGGAGNVTVIMLDGDQVTFTAAALGAVLPVVVSRVLATGTTATLLIGLA